MIIIEILTIRDLHGESVRIEDIPNVAVQVGGVSNYGELDVVRELISDLVAQLDPILLLSIPETTTFTERIC